MRVVGPVSFVSLPLVPASPVQRSSSSESHLGCAAFCTQKAMQGEDLPVNYGVVPAPTSWVLNRFTV